MIDDTAIKDHSHLAGRQDRIHLGSRSESTAYLTGRMSENPVSNANCTALQKARFRSAVKSSYFFVYSFF